MQAGSSIVLRHQRKKGEYNKHPTVKPLKLMQYLCRLVTPPGGIVLDPFAGSGTTLLAAQDEGFNWIGFDNQEQYIEIAEARLLEAAITHNVHV